MAESKIPMQNTGEWKTINTKNWSNWSWEVLAYIRIGNIVFVHGGGTPANTASPLDDYAITNAGELPLPRQNTAIPIVANYAPGNGVYATVTNDGAIKLQSSQAVGDLYVCFSYIAR